MARLPLPPDAAERLPSAWLPWVEAALDGDRTAMARLYRRFQPAVYAIALAKLPPHAAEDVVHDVFVTVMTKLGTLRDPAAFPGWLAALARNRALDHKRRAPRTDDVAMHSLPAESRPTLEAESVLAVVRTLPEAYAETLCMRLVEGMTGPEIAERTGLTEGSVRVNLHRGMKLLRAKLAEEDRHDG